MRTIQYELLNIVFRTFVVILDNKYLAFYRFIVYRERVDQSAISLLKVLDIKN